MVLGACECSELGRKISRSTRARTELRGWANRTGDIHINGGQGTVGDGAAHSTGEGDPGVEADAAELRGLGDSSGLLDDSVDLG